MGILANIPTGPMHPDALFDIAHDKVIINEMATSPEDRAIVLARVTTQLDSNLSLTPSCACGYLKDHLGFGLGITTCPKCHTAVADNMLSTIKPVAFVTVLPHQNTFVQPIFLAHFKSVYNKKGFHTLRYLLDTSYNDKDPTIEALNLPRGMSAFMENIEQIMMALNTIMPFKKKPAANDLLELYRREKQNIHCKSFYLINRTLVIIDKSPLQIRLQKPILMLIDIVLSLLGLNNRMLSTKAKEVRQGKALYQLVLFYEEYFRDIMGGKHGGIRTQLYNIRGPVSMYAPATSITTNLQHPEEIHLPYTPTLHMFYPHVMGKLLRMGYTYPQATAYIHKHTHLFCPMLHKLLEEILQLDKQKVVEFIVQRFPTLWKGSLPVMAVTKVKMSARDRSVSVSILGVSSLNLDLDGDYTVVHPRPPYAAFDRLRMKYNMIDLMKVKSISSALILSKPIVTNIMYMRLDRLANPKPSPVDVQALYG